MEILRSFFSSAQIEYYAVVKYEDLTIINERLLAREDFAPRSAILFLLPYYTLTPRNFSRYAASLDYHLIIREIGEGLERALREQFPDAKMKIYGDHSPIDERGAALTHGLGILGKNGLLINEKYGSYIFIADLLTDIDPALLGATERSEVRGCMGCGRCLASCPTGILRGEGEDCLSAITQRKGELLESEIDLMKKYNTVWGCDLCQSACPYNKNPIPTPIEAFHREVLSELSLDVLCAMDDEEFKRRAFAWRGRAVVERNLAIFE